jgi:hypothetical protein
VSVSSLTLVLLPTRLAAIHLLATFLLRHLSQCFNNMFRFRLLLEQVIGAKKAPFELATCAVLKSAGGVVENRSKVVERFKVDPVV